MESIVGAVLKKWRLVSVGHLVKVMAKFVMDGGEVNRIDLNAHLQAHIFLIVDVPRTGMADDVTILRLYEKRALPECFGQRAEPKRFEERFAIPHHLLGISLSFLQYL